MSLQIRNTALLKPMVALAGWTFVMEVWMYATRLPAVKKYNIDPNPATIGKQFEERIPMSVRQIADNFNHLHEQPTVFYPITIALTLLGDTHPYTEAAAWGYFGIRVVHSLWQSLNNQIYPRLGMFVTSSIVLAGLTGRSAQLLF